MKFLLFFALNAGRDCLTQVRICLLKNKRAYFGKVTWKSWNLSCEVLEANQCHSDCRYLCVAVATKLCPVALKSHHKYMCNTTFPELTQFFPVNGRQDSRVRFGTFQLKVDSFELLHLRVQLHSHQFLEVFPLVRVLHQTLVGVADLLDLHLKLKKALRFAKLRN